MSTHFKELPITAVIFTHFDEKTGEQTDIWVSGIESDQRYKALETVIIPVLPDHAELCARIRGIEPHRLERLFKHPKHVPSDDEFDSPSFPPVSMAEWPDESWLNIDGSHRYVAAYQLGFSWIKAKLLKQDFWRQYQVIGLPREQPDKLINSFSGIR